MSANQQMVPRRRFLRNGALLMLAGGLHQVEGGEEPKQSRRIARIGMLTDMHYADKATRGSRHYRETLAKFDEAATHFEGSDLNFVVELGDFIDAADSVETEMRYLKKINKELSNLSCRKHYVLGNHCVDTLTKDEFLGEVGQEKSYYSFDVEGVHFVVLDSCYRADETPYGRKNFKWTDANIPEAELEWLKADLAAAEGKPVIVFAHQRLDITGNHAVRNAEAVRKVFESAGNVSAVFQGHSHHNEHRVIATMHLT